MLGIEVQLLAPFCPIRFLKYSFGVGISSPGSQKEVALEINQKWGLVINYIEDALFCSVALCFIW